MDKIFLIPRLLSARRKTAAWQYYLCSIHKEELRGWYSVDAWVDSCSSVVRALVAQASNLDLIPSDSCLFPFFLTSLDT